MHEHICVTDAIRMRLYRSTLLLLACGSQVSSLSLQLALLFASHMLAD